ncbi:MAG: GDSL family lipase [Saprospiraceae bacterium]|nr:GDSL family lipase [Saprospiraceae bacterium]
MKKILLLILPVLALAFGKKDTPRVFLAGDSTMAPKKATAAPETGWGMVFPAFFDTSAVKFENHAVNGRSTKSFRTLGHWDNMIARVHPGDYVFLQFGHNDSKVSDSLRYAPARTDYRDNLIRFIGEIRAKGGQPVLLTPVVRRKFDDKGQYVDQHGDYPAVVREVAAAQKVPLIDLWAKSKQLLERLGPDDSKRMFLNLPPATFLNYPDGKNDNTHFTPYGAALVAALVAEGVRESDMKLRDFLKRTEFEGKYAYELPVIDVPEFKPDTFNILDFGAKAGGIFLNTHAINTAIDTCSSRGGGVVLVPAGLWLTGPISLRNHVNLHVAQGALVQFSNDHEQYPLIRTNWEGLEAIRCQSPLSGIDQEDIAITGKGIFDGAGLAWRPLKRDKVTEREWKEIVASGGVLNEAKNTWYPTARALRGASMTRAGVVAEGFDEAKALEVKEFLRPNMLSLINCKRVLIDGPTFQNSPAWTLHTLLGTNFTLKNVTVKNPSYAQNGDGVDVESTRFFHIEDCVFDTGDDGVCLKSGRNEEGRKRGVPTSDGIVKGCVVYKAHGGFVVGSEMSGGVRNIFVSGCTFLGSDIGLRFKTTRGRGGVVEDIYITDINMTDIPHEAILFDMYYNGKEAAEALKNPEMKKLPFTEETPTFRNIHIQNIACRGAEHAVYIQGLPESNVQQILVENSVFHSDHGVTCVEANGIHLKNVTLKTNTTDPAFFMLNSRNMTFEGVEVSGKASGGLRVEGRQAGDIKLSGSNVEKLGIQYGEGVPQGIIKK